MSDCDSTQISNAAVRLTDQMHLLRNVIDGFGFLVDLMPEDEDQSHLMRVVYESLDEKFQSAFTTSLKIHDSAESPQMVIRSSLGANEISVDIVKPPSDPL